MTQVADNPYRTYTLPTGGSTLPIRFRPLTEQHVNLAAEMLEDASIWHPTSQVLGPVARCLSEGFWYTAWVKEELIGVVGFHAVSMPDGRAEIFTALVPNWRGKGLAAKLAQAQISFAWNDLGLRRLTMTTLADGPSAKIANKMGLHPEGRMPRYRLKGGVYHDALVYGLEKGGT